MKAFCRIHHGHQKDKAGEDYVEGHLARVAGSFQPYTREWYVAWLHDILEDTGCTENELAEALQKDTHAQHFYPEIIEAVRTITKIKDEDYDDYLNRVKQNVLARKVKIADMRHNTDLSRLPHPGPEDYKRVEKYKKAIPFLEVND